MPTLIGHILPMTIDDVEYFLFVLFVILVMFIVSISILFGVINGDFKPFKYGQEPKEDKIGDLYEKFVEFISRWMPDI